ncbi:hypothetical protein MKW94_002070, partial [Papaver nudicaule]|nr:hypothetical protein [Papaver nudicaule]
MGRGKAKLTFLQDLEPNQRLPIEAHKELLIPLGENATFLTKFISNLSSDGNKLPLTINDWKNMSADLIANVVLEIK